MTVLTVLGGAAYVRVLTSAKLYVNGAMPSAFTKEPQMSQALLLAATTPEHHTDLPMSPNMYGLIAIVVFLALLGLVWTFRGNSNKHR
jgi:hypothetical protein